jgi:methionyl-tRNA formyltransferase
MTTTRVLFVGAYAYASDVLDALIEYGPRPYVVTAFGPGHQRIPGILYSDAFIKALRPDLIVVAGWRRLIPPDVLAVPRYGTVGFHSARLPEYPGRAPVPWALLRGDTETANTMLYLDEGVDSGDIVDERTIPIVEGDTPSALYERMARTSVEMLRQHLPALLAGNAPRRPQDLSRRGPLTTPDGWQRWESSRSSPILTTKS